MAKAAATAKSTTAPAAQTDDQEQPGQPQEPEQQQDPGGDEAPKAPEQPQAPEQPKAPAAAVAASRSAAPVLTIVPEAKGRTDARARELLFRACEVFGVNPTTEARPLELDAWRFYPGDPREGVPDGVTLVTRGGLKLKWWADEDFPLDPDTDEKLGMVFNAFRIDAATKLKVRVALPDDLTLPRTAVTGLGESQEHVYKGGYLRSGGAKEAGRRQAARQAREQQ